MYARIPKRRLLLPPSPRPSLPPASRSNGLAAYVLGDEDIAAKTALLKKAATAQGAALRPRLLARGALVRVAPHVLPQRIFAGEPFHVSSGGRAGLGTWAGLGW